MCIRDRDKTDLEIQFVINAAPTFSGDVNVKLGGQFDDKTLKVATVKAPVSYTHLQSKKTQAISLTHQEKLHSHSLKESK